MMRIADTLAPAIRAVAFAPRPGSRVPATLPGGRAWPRIAVIVLAHDATGAEASIVSLREQDYPSTEAVVVEPSAHRSAHAVFPEALARLDAEYVLVLDRGARLAPGALLSAALAAVREAADVVCGLRVVAERGKPVLVDCSAAPPGLLDPAGLDALLAGGELLRRSDTLVATDVLRAILAGVARPATLAVLGRPMSIVESGGGDAPPLERLKIAALTDTGLTGGAGIAHGRIIEALRLAGHVVEVKHLAPDTPKWAAEWTSRFPDVENEILSGGFDLVLAGNIHGATRSVAALARLHERVPVAAVLHDLFLLTGRCAHPAGCERIIGGCDAGCPTADVFPELAPDRIGAAWLEKQQFLGGRRPPILLANSPWTASQARAFAPPNAAVEEIALPFPTGIFRPRDRREARRALGLPEHDVLVMCAAQVVDAPHKGTGELAAALRRVARPGVRFVIAGRVDNPGAFGVPRATFPGRIAEEHQLAAYYAACDLFVTASRVETLGQTPIEAGLSGTPSIAYRTTGLTAAVIDGVTGRLAAPAPTALAQAIQALIDDPGERERLAFFARLALESRNSHAAAYLSLRRALAGHGIVPAKGPLDRIAFRPELLDTFADTAPPSPIVADAPVARHSRMASVVPRLRRAKQAIWGARTPLWVRRTAHAMSLLSRAVARSRRRPIAANAGVPVYVDQTHVRGHITGIERVALELLSPTALPGFDVRPVRSRGILEMIVGQQLGMPVRAARDRAALFVFPGFPPGPLALAARERTFIYVHDIFLLTRPADLNWSAWLYMRPSFALALRYGRRFLVNSESTARALRPWTHRSASIALLRPHVADVFAVSDLPAGRSRWDGAPLRLLAIGTIEPRKNYAGAVSIVHALRAAGVEAELDIVGRFGWGKAPELRDPPPFIRVHGYLDATAVRQLLADAHALLCTSHAEGLGLPLVEVQHGGLPVIAPEGEVFREVLGASALFIDPATPDRAAASIAAWVSSPEGLAAAGAASRANVARWNGLAAADAQAFRDMLASAAASRGRPRG